MHETLLLHGIHNLQDAYYSVPIAKKHQKNLKFIWQGNLYQFSCLAQLFPLPPSLHHTYVAYV